LIIFRRLAMRRVVCLVVTVILILGSCLSSGRSSSRNRLEERVISDAVMFTDDEFEIYDYLIDVLIAKHSKRAPPEAMAELIDKYGYEELIKNPQLIEAISVQIENPKIVVSDKTTIPSLTTSKTFDENMESSSIYVTKNMGEKYNELFSDFKEKNEFDYSLEEYIAKNDKTISEDLVRSAMGDEKVNNYWKKFYEINPNACGQTTFSRVGFKDNNAFVEVKFIWGYMSGFIDYIIFEKIGDSWKALKSNRRVYY
jgi:hypothetical protein